MPQKAEETARRVAGDPGQGKLREQGPQVQEMATPQSQDIFNRKYFVFSKPISVCMFFVPPFHNLLKSLF